MSKKVRVAIAGVGNCASALVQGTSYYHRYHSSDDHKKGNENENNNNNNNNNVSSTCSNISSSNDSTRYLVDLILPLQALLLTTLEESNPRI